MFFFSKFLLSLGSLDYYSKVKNDKFILNTITLNLKKLKNKLVIKKNINKTTDSYFDLYSKHKKLEKIVKRNKYDLSIDKNDLKTLNEINNSLKNFKATFNSKSSKENNDLLKLVESEISQFEKPFFKLKSGKLLFNIKDLYDAIVNMPQKEYIQYVNYEKNDFFDWILNDLKNKEVAYELKEDNSKTNTLNVLRKYNLSQK